MRRPVTLALVAAALTLAGCQDEKPKQQDQRTAVGEILPGSASDAMLPYDSLRSQPPLAPQTLGSGKTKPGKGTATDAPGASNVSAAPSTSSLEAAPEVPAAAGE
jgi:hypothetical protein